MEAEALTQMNVRMGAHIKQAGDDALSSIGFTPTQAVRALWKYAAQRGEALEEVKQFLVKAESDSAQGESAMAALHEGWHIIPDGLATLGVSAEAMAQASQDEASIIEEARLERAAQKGWL